VSEGSLERQPDPGPALARTSPTVPRLPSVRLPQIGPQADQPTALSRMLLSAGAPWSNRAMVAAFDPPPDVAGRLAADADRLTSAWSGLGAGEPVGKARQPFEQSYGRGLSAARTHIGTAAAQRVTSTLGVQALTVGNHMVFASSPAERVLGHELAHVVQQTSGPPAGAGGLRAAGPDSVVEHDAERAASAALGGVPYHLGPSDGEDLAMLVPLAWLAIAALIAGVGIGVAAEVSGPSYDENRRRAERRRLDDSAASWAEAAWLWVPVAGTATRIWEAQSAGERVFNIVMMPIDVLTLGAVGSSVGKIANRALWQTALREASAAELSNLATSGVRAVTQAEVQAGARAALEAGQAVVATVGRRNHAIVFVKVAGKYYRLSGGAMRSMAVREMPQFAPTSINAFYAFGGAAESAAVLNEARAIAGTWSGLGFTFRSCGISAATLTEAGGINVGLSRTAAYLPITVMGTLAEQGVVTASTTGARRMITGTAFNWALMGSLRGGATLASNDNFSQFLVDQLIPRPVLSTPATGGGGGAGATGAPGLLDGAVEVSADEVFAAVDAGSGADIALTDAPLSYLNLRSRLEPDPGGAAGNLSVQPIYSFYAADTEANASVLPDPARVVDVSTDPTTGPGVASDPRRVLELADRPQYRTGAQQLMAAFTGPGPLNGTWVLDHAHDFFPFTFDSVEARDAAAAALERAGLTGADLDRAVAVLRR